MVLATGLLLSSCSESGKKYPEAGELKLEWELLGNYVGGEEGFRARFTIFNESDMVLTDDNWKLFFNQGARLLKDPEPTASASVKHINGDWYTMEPNEGFRLTPGEEIDVVYKGHEFLIKNSDKPLGAYFVFYDRDGETEKIVSVPDVALVPFEREEQITRHPADEEPIPTPGLRYRENKPLKVLDEGLLPAVLPTPVKTVRKAGSLDFGKLQGIAFEPGLDQEADLLARKLNGITGVALPVREVQQPEKGTITIQTGQVTVRGKNSEAYVLEVRQDGVVITGSDAAGVFYGIQSFLSLIPLDVYRETSGSFTLSCLTLEDAPRFGFRGLHVDVARNFQSKETLLRILDLMAFYKLNRLLLYTTEDEGWRLEIEGLPELTEVGAKREHTSAITDPVLHPAYGSGPVAYADNTHGSGYYTRADFIQILKYASERHIKVIPELNFPGHARAAIKAMEARYARLMAEGKEMEAEEYRLIDPDDQSQYMSAQNFTDNVVSVARESAYSFYEKVVDEISAMYAEAGLQLDEFHAGGDEVPEGSWTKSPMAQALLDKHPEIGDPKNLQAYFFRELVKRMEKRNIRVHGWEEVALLKTKDGSYVPNPEFVDRDVVPYIWNNLWDYDLGYRLANYGYDVVLCNVSNFYFDLAYNKDPMEPGLYWAGFVKTRDAWAFAPFDYFKTTPQTNMGRLIDMEKEFADVERLKPEARDNILGIEAQLWSETIKGRDMIEYYMLPKLLGFAESAWTDERIWENTENREVREQQIEAGWNVFANTLAQRELPRLSFFNNGYNYRLPLPGAVIEDGMLKANVEFPGLEIRYTTDGSEPQLSSPLYDGPVEISGTVRLRSFDSSGKSSRVVTVSSSGS
jgi:hexosaminidase